MEQELAKLNTIITYLPLSEANSK